MTKVRKNLQKGFTLVELAIVLVIIGLIVSGVLVGQDLIKAAELRATTRQLTDFQVGVNTFIGKYGSIPGDIQGDKYGLDGLAASIDGTTGDGDGNGIITETNATTVLTMTGEMSTFWSNLTTDGKELIKGAYNGDNCTTSESDASCYVGQDMPKLPFGGTGWAVFGESGTNYFVSGIVSGDSTVTNTTVDFIPIDLFNIDNKIDDGVPTTGDVQAVNSHATDINTQANGGASPHDEFTSASVDADFCIDTGTPDAYQFTSTTVQCMIRVKMQTF